MRLIDISMPLGPGMPAFPGDPLFSTERTHSLDRGDAYNVSRLTMGSHAGTHVDPPVHFVKGGVGIDAVPLERLNGMAQVVDVPSSVTRIEPAHLATLPAGTERVLFRTANSARWARALEFFGDYVALGDPAAAMLVSRGVRLVGIDALSIERDPDGQFPVHHRLLSSGVAILEGLLLAEAPTGPQELVCLPLRIRAGDGGPARAALRLS